MNRQAYFAAELNCFKMLRDCRSMLAVKSNQLFYLTLRPVQGPTQGPALSLHQEEKVQTCYPSLVEVV